MHENTPEGHASQYPVIRFTHSASPSLHYHQEVEISHTLHCSQQQLKVLLQLTAEQFLFGHRAHCSSLSPCWTRMNHTRKFDRPSGFSISTAFWQTDRQRDTGAGRWEELFVGRDRSMLLLLLLNNVNKLEHMKLDLKLPLGHLSLLHGMVQLCVVAMDLNSTIPQLHKHPHSQFQLRMRITLSDGCANHQVKSVINWQMNHSEMHLRDYEF